MSARRKVRLWAPDPRVVDEAAHALRDAGFDVGSRLAPDSARLEMGELVIDVAWHEVRLQGRPIHLTSMEFRLLVALAEEPGVVLEPEQLLARAWGPEYLEDVGYIKPIVSRLRRKLHDDPRRPRWIETVRGFGYRLRPKAG